MDAPRPQQVALFQRDVFVKDVHAAADKEVRRPCSSSRALRPRRTASVMAALLILLPCA